MGSDAKAIAVGGTLLSRARAGRPSQVLMEISAADSIIEAEKVLWKMTIIPSRAGGIFRPNGTGHDVS